MQKPPNRTPILIKPPPGPPPKFGVGNLDPSGKIELMPHIEKDPIPNEYGKDIDFRIESPDPELLYVNANDAYLNISGGFEPLQIGNSPEMLNQALIGKMVQFMEDYSMPMWVKCEHCQSPNLFQNFECVKCGAPLTEEKIDEPKPKRQENLKNIIRHGLT